MVCPASPARPGGSAAIRWAVVPAAGRGRRIRSLAGGASKEMIPVGSSPLIDHTLSDLRSGGIERVAVVVHPEKEDLAAHLRHHRAGLDIHLVPQDEPLGVAHALLQARELVGDEPFVAFMPDNCPVRGPGLTVQLQQAFRRRPGWVLGLLALPPARLGRFAASGFVAWEPLEDRELDGGPTLVRILGVQDKGSGPPPARQGSCLKGFPASVMLGDFFARATRLRPCPRSGELEDTPILQALAREGIALGAILDGVVCDCGIPAGLEEARERLEDGG